MYKDRYESWEFLQTNKDTEAVQRNKQSLHSIFCFLHELKTANEFKYIYIFNSKHVRLADRSCFHLDGVGPQTTKFDA